MNSPKTPLVSIGVPVFNGQDKIERALYSLLNQTYRDIHVVVSDNASTDKTREICERISDEDSRVHYVRQPINMGPVENFKEVLNLSRGEYFMWLGHDDWLSETYIEHCVETLVDNPDVSLACGQALYYRGADEDFRGTAVQLTHESPKDRVTAYLESVSDNGTFFGLMRREQLVKVRLAKVMGSDWLVVASIAFLGKVVTLPSISVHRALGGSTDSYEKIAKTVGLGKHQAIFPHVAISFFAFRDIAWRDAVYSLDRFERVALAWKCQRIIRLRHSSSLIGILRTCLGLAKRSCQRRVGSTRRM